MSATKRSSSQSIRQSIHRSIQQSILLVLLCGQPLTALAQSIVFDGSLGSTRALVGPNYQVQQGEGRSIGTNLFHSFRQFNLNTGESVTFESTPNIRNILSRVTGGTRSEIDGLIATQRGVNLFLLNPSGILFGSNASLNVGGSFVASTADAIGFGERGWFSATAVNEPSPLLSIDPSTVWFNRVPAGDIVSQSIVPSRPGGSILGLQVPNGENLVLLGGNVSIDGGNGVGRAGLHALGGRVAIGAVGGVGAIGLGEEGRLSFPDNVARADVVFDHRSIVNVALDGGGDIHVIARNIDILNNSRLQAGINARSGSAMTQAGNVELDATEAIRMAGLSRIQNDVTANSIGRAGTLSMTTRSLSMTSGAQLSSSTFGQGNAGDVVINAGDRVVLEGIDASGRFVTAIFSNVENNSVGAGGNINIRADSVSLLNGAQLQTIVRQAFSTQAAGQGNAGNITIETPGAVTLSGNTSIFSSSIFTGLGAGARGQSGDILIRAGSFSLRGDNVTIFASTSGQGNAGNIRIAVRDRTTLEGGSLFSTVSESAIGAGGEIRLSTGSLSVRNGSTLSAATAGQGNAGNITIHARDRMILDGTNPAGESSSVGSAVNPGAIGNGGEIRISTNLLSITNGAELLAYTLGQGNAGNITVHARDRMILDGTSRDGQVVGGAFSTVDPGAIGDGGDIRISTRFLSVRNGAQLQASTAGQGNAGDILINARDRVLFDGRSADGQYGSDAFSTVDSEAIGDGGDIRISTRFLSVTRGAQLQASTSGRGNAGNVLIRASDRVVIDGVGREAGRSSGLTTFNTSDSSGRSGEIRIIAGSLRLSNGGILNAQTNNDRRGGNVMVQANAIDLTRGGQVTTTTASSGSAGNITLNADRITLEGFDPTFANRRRRFPDRVANQGAESGLFANTDRNTQGSGGGMNLNATELNLLDRARISVNSQGRGTAGNVTINAAIVRLSDRSQVIAESASEDGGDITLNDLDLLLLRRNSSLSTTATGNGGNISIDANFLVAVPAENSDIAANAVQGRGGQVEIDTQGVFGFSDRAPRNQPGNQPGNQQNSQITASSEQGPQGIVTIRQPDVDPTQGLVELPTNLVDSTQQIAQNCTSRGRGNQFVVTGRGGLPLSPDELLRGSAIVSPAWVGLTEDTEPTGSERERRAFSRATSDRILEEQVLVEATGWMTDANGQVALVAQLPTPDLMQIQHSRAC